MDPRLFVPKSFHRNWLPAIVSLILSPVLAAETVLFHDDFNGAPLDGLPQTQGQGGPWHSVSTGHGELKIADDPDELFGAGTGNRFLRGIDAGNFNVYARLDSPSEVVRLSFDFVGRSTENDHRWLNINFYAGDGNHRAHVLSLRPSAATIRGVNPEAYYGSNDEVRHFEVFVNNAGTRIVYPAPDGTERSLSPGTASVWINGESVISSYVFARSSSGVGPIHSFNVNPDSESVVTFDIDEVTVTEPEYEEEEPPNAVPGEDGRLAYTKDHAGNRIPDFSSAGYMGGGVPIPEDVPVMVTLEPEAGDDTERIQAAIDTVAVIPEDQDGFRGAVLLKRGAYEVEGSLRISSSGIVLRGEGRGEDGTVIHATGTIRRTLIEVGATAGTWNRTSGNRIITDAYVPVGARSFRVDDASGLEVGDTIIVYRPSTEEWISAIGMDEIPERSDGLPITQWQAGQYDIQYDRVITAIDGNEITIDAPVMNALEDQYGGGWIYTYTFPERISQVGIENIRSVSAYDGSPDDEDHAWTFVVFDRVQNAWARELTGVHFGFGTVLMERRSKWITVEDSALLDPISTISGSRRYPFYVQGGQLCLVQRCYARYARHDYGTSSRTHGPNVFLQSRGEHSYSDTGPHHRWATGALYDNIEIPHRDINVQNRLNFGSGHGWAGANHVIWNSSANRIANQNPPTAQNWAIGVKGTKWAGSFPDYAEDGYWISQGEHVNPQSLYLKQLEDRLDPDRGSGGLISIVSFGETNGVLVPSEDDSFTWALERRGIRDGRIWVEYEVTGPGADLIDVEAMPETVGISVNRASASLPVRLVDGAFIPEATEVSLRLRHGTAYSAGRESTAVLAIAARPIDTWWAENFSEEERNDPETGADLASPAGDGIPNLVKYALDLDPWQPAQPGDLPVAEISEGRLSLTYERPIPTPDIRFVVEVSENLSDWYSGDEYTEEEVSTLGETERVTVRDNTPVAGTSKRFMRLRVERL